MCGITAFYSFAPSAPLPLVNEVETVNDSMLARGPDGSGVWYSRDRSVALAHRRLAIIDLSDSGAQPMSDVAGSVIITFNGEIYNYRELRAELEALGTQFRSSSDTEVILHLYNTFGVSSVSRLRGMFSFAIWDCIRNRLFAARDHFGIKPLYYSERDGRIAIASQVKSLSRLTWVGKQVDVVARGAFYLLGYVPDPLTIYSNIKSLAAGSYLTVDQESGVSISKYYDVSNVIAGTGGFSSNLLGDTGRERFASLLRDSVRCHLIADVPTGVFLSSGLDSATITALATEVAGDGINTVTLAFEEYKNTQWDESYLAEEIACVYGTKHRRITISETEFKEHLCRILTAMDQPTIDGVNSYFISLAAREAGLKVALSGLGGDELFAGYPSFWQVPLMVSSTKPFATVPSLGKSIGDFLAKFGSSGSSSKQTRLLQYGTSYNGAYFLKRGLFMPEELPSILGVDESLFVLEKLSLLSELGATIHEIGSPRGRVTALELTWYMRSQLLRDSDWASMAHSLEIRTPLVDVRLFEGCLSLMKEGCITKGEMANVPSRELPQSVLRRKKTGFVVPIYRWLREEAGGVRGAEWGPKDWAKFVVNQF